MENSPSCRGHGPSRLVRGVRPRAEYPRAARGRRLAFGDDPDGHLATRACYAHGLAAVQGLWVVERRPSRQRTRRRPPRGRGARARRRRPPRRRRAPCRTTQWAFLLRPDQLVIAASGPGLRRRRVDDELGRPPRGRSTAARRPCSPFLEHVAREALEVFRPGDRGIVALVRLVAPAQRGRRTGNVVLPALGPMTGTVLTGSALTLRCSSPFVLGLWYYWFNRSPHRCRASRAVPGV